MLLLCHLNVFGDLLVLSLAWQTNAEHTVLYSRHDLVAVDIVGQLQTLLKVGVRELAAQIAHCVVLLLILILVLHLDVEHSVLIDADVEVVLGHARSGQLNLLTSLVLHDVDGRSGGLHAGCAVVV